MLTKLKNLLLYAGFAREQYRSALPTIQNTNRVLTGSVSALATILIFAMYLSSSSVEGVKQNQSVYLVGLIVSSMLFLTSLLFSKKYPVLITPLMMVAYSIFYIYGILIGTITSPGEKTVTFIVMLVYLPTLFVDRPLHMILITVFYDFIFLVLCFQTKTGAVLDNDVADALAFGAIGVISGAIISHMKVRSYIREQELEKINRIDSLTGMQNRKAYDTDLEVMSELGKKSLACIYLDVNGLKYLNDTFRHKEGDKMLMFVADKIVGHFGKKLTYRLGGDEFCIFVPDPKQLEISTRTNAMVEEIEALNYHVSIGWEIGDGPERVNIHELVKGAETRMYEKKKMFYIEHPEFNLRS